MNELVDRIESVLMVAARRRAARRRRRAVLAMTVLGLLVLVSGASAVSGVGPLGDVLTADEELPPGAKPDPRGASVLLVGEGADGRRYEVRAYRARGKSPRFKYCVASYSARRDGKRDPISIICTSGAELAAHLERRPLWLHCSGRGGVVGEPAPPDPVCGLTRASTRSVTIEPNRGSAGPVRLSEPFPMQVSSERAVSVRAVFGVVNASLTQPGRRKPRVQVTALADDGSRFVTHVGGERLLTRADLPSLDPRPLPSGPTAAVRAPGWEADAWRSVNGGFCAGANPLGTRRPALDRIYMPGNRGLVGCLYTAELGRLRAIVRRGAAGFVTRLRGSRVQGVFGLARADRERLSVRDSKGRVWPLRLSEPWTVWRRRANDLAPIPRRYRSRFAGLPRAVRVRLFLGVLPADAAPRLGIRLRFE